MAKAGATVKVAKNRLAKLALDGHCATGLADLFKGPTMLAYAGDPIAAPKVATGFARQNDKFVVLGGTLGGSRLDPQVSRPWQTCPRSTNCGRGSLA